VPDLIAGYAYMARDSSQFSMVNPDAFVAEDDSVFARMQPGYNPTRVAVADTYLVPEVPLSPGRDFITTIAKKFCRARGGDLFLFAVMTREIDRRANTLPGRVTALTAGRVSRVGWVDGCSHRPRGTLWSGAADL